MPRQIHRQYTLESRDFGTMTDLYSLMITKQLGLLFKLDLSIEILEQDEELN